MTRELRTIKSFMEMLDEYEYRDVFIPVPDKPGSVIVYLYSNRIIPAELIFEIQNEKPIALTVVLVRKSKILRQEKERYIIA